MYKLLVRIVCNWTVTYCSLTKVYILMHIHIQIYIHILYNVVNPYKFVAKQLSVSFAALQLLANQLAMFKKKHTKNKPEYKKIQMKKREKKNVYALKLLKLFMYWVAFIFDFIPN